MRSTNRKKRRFRATIRLMTLISSLVLILALGLFTLSYIAGEEDVTSEEPLATENNPRFNEAEPEEQVINQPVKPVKEPKEAITIIRLSAVGDIMAHAPQLESAFNVMTQAYDFNSVFEDIKPILDESDLSIANLETTLAGPSKPYIGYPTFNTPDAMIDALMHAGFDTLITANNHSLDNHSEGLRRTVETINQKGIDAVGTYASGPDARVLIKEVNGIKLAILGYTEHVNGLEALYTDSELVDMINVLSEEQLIKDIEEAKALEPDLIISYMHWGQEYADEPNDFQVHYANVLTREGVDIILGSHPHVIQRAEMLEVDGNESFVIYSMGNFISNQRRETLGEGYEATEDGVIINFEIHKNETSGGTTIEEIEFIPTWVYRMKEAEQSTFTYRILPIEPYLESPDLPESMNKLAKESYDRTLKRLSFE